MIWTIVESFLFCRKGFTMPVTERNLAQPITKVQYGKKATRSDKPAKNCNSKIVFKEESELVIQISKRRKYRAYKVRLVLLLIIKITISSIMIGLKNSYFPLIHLPVCYRTVQQTNHIQSCSLNQPITFNVVV